MESVGQVVNELWRMSRRVGSERARAVNIRSSDTAVFTQYTVVGSLSAHLFSSLKTIDHIYLTFTSV